MNRHPFHLLYYLLLGLFVLPQLSNAQQSDSTLLIQLKQASQDTVKIKIYNQLSYNNRYRNASLLKKYAFAALRLTDTTKTSIILGDTYNNIQRYYHAIAQYPLAIQYANKALMAYTKVNHSMGICSALNNLGIISEERGDLIKAIDYHFKSLRLAEKLKAIKRIGISQNNIASIYQSIGQYDKALEYFEKSLAINQQNNDIRGSSISEVNIAEIYWLQKKYDKALEYAQKSIASARKSQTTLVSAVGLKYLAMVQAVKSDTLNALANFKKSYDMFAVQDFALENVRLLSEMAKYYLRLDSINKSKKLGNQVLEKALKIGAKKEIKDIYQVLSKVYEQLGQNDKALKFYKSYATYKDSLSADNARNILIQRELQRVYDKKEAQIKTVTNEQINQRNVYLIIISGGLLLVLTFTFFIFKASRRQRKLNRMLKTQQGALKAVNQHLQEKQSEVEASNQELKFLNHRLKSGESVITKAYDQLQNRNKQLKNNIRAALTIQQAILPTPELIKELLPEHFILYLPKDIVSGDFYWVNQVKDKTIMIFADCTGHGVQGAFMSLIGHNLLDKIILQQNNTDPASILTQLDEQVQVALHLQESRSIEGMDIGIIAMETATNGQRIITYAGAKRPLYYINSDNPDEICLVKGIRKSIGGIQKRKKAFENKRFTLPLGSLLYGGTDGLTDQHDFQRKKLGSLRLREVLLEWSNLPLNEQETNLFALIQSHMINTEQRDDILWVGIQV